MHICGRAGVYLPKEERRDGVYLPETQCSSCEFLEARVASLEKKLDGKQEVEITKTDREGTIAVTVLGSVERS